MSRKQIQYDNGEWARAYEVVTTPDEARDEAERRWPVMAVGYTDDDGTHFEYESTENRRLREAYLAGFAAGFRKQETVSDAEVEAFKQEINARGAVLWADHIRAGLVAARAVTNGGTK